MLKHLGSATVLTVSFSLLAVAPASAGGCGLLGLSPCPPAVTVLPPVVVAPPVPPPAGVPGTVPVPVAPPAPAPVAQPQALPSGNAPEAAAALLQMVNQERSRAKLPALESRAAILTFAAGHSAAMAGRGDIWHNDAYFGPSSRSTLGARRLGENVALNGSVENAHARLMASPGHRANILNGAFDAIGVAVVRDASGALFITEDFVDSRVPPKVKPRRAPRTRVIPKPSRPATTRR